MCFASAASNLDTSYPCFRSEHDFQLNNSGAFSSYSASCSTPDLQYTRQKLTMLQHASNRSSGWCDGNSQQFNCTAWQTGLWSEPMTCSSSEQQQQQPDDDLLAEIIQGSLMLHTKLSINPSGQQQQQQQQQQDVFDTWCNNQGPAENKQLMMPHTGDACTLPAAPKRYSCSNNYSQLGSNDSSTTSTDVAAKVGCWLSSNSGWDCCSSLSASGPAAAKGTATQLPPWGAAAAWHQQTQPAAAAGVPASVQRSAGVLPCTPRHLDLALCSEDMNAQMQEWLGDMEGRAAAAGIACGLAYGSSSCAWDMPEMAIAAGASGGPACAAAAQLVQDVPAPAFVILGLMA